MKIKNYIEKRLWLYILVTLISFLSIHHWIFELFSHFPIQFFLIGLIAACFCLFQKKFKPAIIILLAMSTNGYIIIQDISSNRIDPQQNQKQPLKFILSNIQYSNNDYDKIFSYIQQENPDFFSLLEIKQHQANALHERFQSLGYTQNIIKFDSGNFGIAFYSRYKIIHQEIKFFGQTQIPSIYATIDWNDQILSIIASHPPPPAGGEYAHERNFHLQNLALFIAEKPQNSWVVMMDMNTTPWSPYFTKFVQESQLYDSRQGFGIQATWPTFMPLLWIPIDHVFLSKNINVMQRRTGPSIGSDHYPIDVLITL